MRLPIHKRMFFRGIAAVLTLIVIPAIASAQAVDPSHTGSLSGVVQNKATQTPIPGATIVIVGTKRGAVTHPDGTFAIANIPVGSYQLKITCVGYEPKIYSDVIVATGHTSPFTVDMIERNITLDTVSIQANAFEKSADNITSVNSFNYEEVRRQPGAVEDVSRMVQSLPGVSFSNDGRNDLIVRGGAPTENLTLLDGFEIPNINHFGTQGATGGAIGMVDVNLIDNVDFSSGGFGAEYGDKLSSELSVRMRDGSRDHFQGDVDFNTSGIGGVIEGPLGDNGSYIASARRSYLNLIHNLIGLTAVPNYQDAFFKAIYDISPTRPPNRRIIFCAGFADSSANAPSLSVVTGLLTFIPPNGMNCNVPEGDTYGVESACWYN